MAQESDDLKNLFAAGLGGASGDIEFDEIIPELEGYSVDRKLGGGGMGVVFLGRNERLDRAVALKVLRGSSDDSLEAERLAREGHVLAKLDHPCIVRVHDFRFDQDQHPCLILEYMDAGDLSERLAQGALPREEALQAFTCIVDAVAHAHAQGVLHRDLKPSNILFNSEGILKVGDFGLASLERSEALMTLTLSGTTAGTEAYMSPEQKLGEKLDARSDIYSLGVILYEMLCGRRPQGVFSPLPQRHLDRVVRRCLQEKPSDRYSNCAELLADLTEKQKRNPALALFLLSGLAALSFESWRRFPAFRNVIYNLTPLREDSATEASPTPIPTTLPEATATPRPETIPVVVQPTATPLAPPTPFPTPIPPEATPTPLPETSPHMQQGFAEPVAGKLDVLALLNEQFAESRKRGAWHFDEHTLHCQQGEDAQAWIEFPIDPGDSYDLVLVSTRLEGQDSLPLFFPTAAGPCALELDAWRRGIGGFQNVDGQDLRTSGRSFPIQYHNGTPVNVLLSVRRDSISVRVNGEMRQRLELDNRELSFPPIWRLPDTLRFGIGVWDGSARFDRLEWRKVDEGPTDRNSP